MHKSERHVVGLGGRAAHLLNRQADEVVAHTRVWARKAPCPGLSYHTVSAHIASPLMHILVRVRVRAPLRIAIGWLPSSGSPFNNPSAPPARPSGRKSSSDRGPTCSPAFKF